MSDGVAILPDDAVGQRIKVKDVQSLPKAVIRIPTVHFGVFPFCILS